MNREKISEEELYKRIKKGEIKNLRIDSRPIIEVEKMISTGNIELYTKDYVNELQQKINKAIEYIENKKDFLSNGYYLKKGRENELLDYILSILRGEE